MSVDVQSRQDISKSFEATTRLLNDLDALETNAGDMEKLHNNIDGLIGSLSNTTFDIHADLEQVMESFSKGHVTARVLEEMVRTEHARSLMLTKLTGAMKVQLEEVFTAIEKVADVSEQVLQSSGKEDSRSRSSPTVDIKGLSKQVNRIYGDFSEVMFTVDSLEEMVKAPAVRVVETIGKMQPHIESKLSSPVAHARRLSTVTGPGMPYNFASRAACMPTMGPDTTESGEGDGLVAIQSAVSAATGDGEDMISSASAVGTGELNLAWPNPGIGVSNPIKARSALNTPIRVHALVNMACQTDLVERHNASPVHKASNSSPSKVVGVAYSPEQHMAPLVIRGEKPPPSTKEINRVKRVLAERAEALTLREDTLLQQQIVLDLRAEELRKVAQKVVQHESEAQTGLREVERVVQQRVKAELASLGVPRPEEKETKCIESDTMKIEEKAMGDKDISGLDLDAEFLQRNILAAQTAHVHESMLGSPSMHDEITDGSNELMLQGEGVQRNGSRHASRPVTPELLLRASSLPRSQMSYSPTPDQSKNINILSAYSQNQRQSQNQNHKNGQFADNLSIFSGNGLNDRIASMSPINVPPPQKIMPPDMIVIFPPKTVNKSTTTEDLLMDITSASSLSGGQKKLSTKVLITSRDRSGNFTTKKSKEPLSDMLPSENNSLVMSTSSLVHHSNQRILPHEANLRKDLPTVASKDGFATRTYGHAVPRDIKKELAQSENPLLMLYDEFADVLPDVFHVQLLDAASGKSSLKAAGTFNKLFTAMLPDIHKLDNSTSIVLKELSLCEEMANHIIIVAGSGEIPDEHYNRAYDQMFKKFGEIEVLKLWVEVQLGQYRIIFERVNSMKITMIPSMVRVSQVFEEAYETFVSSSGRAVEAQSRFTALKNRCKRYRIGHVNPDTNGAQMQGRDVNMEQYLRMQDEIEILREALAEAEEEAEDLNLEVFKSMQEGDRTPAALMFFSALHDPVFVSILQQITMQLKALKGFSDGSDHIDFGALRKRLQVCISSLPNVDRFVVRYNSMHKKWCTNRLGLFTSKAQVGGGSDSVNLCPMCSNDPAKFAPPGGYKNRLQQAEIRKNARREQDKLHREEQEAAANRQQFVQLDMYTHRTRSTNLNQQQQRTRLVEGSHTMTDSIMSMGSRSRSEHSLPSVVKIPA